MKIYLIRHGESEGNAKNIRQGADVPLTEQGIKQAEFLATRLMDLPIDLIISSPYLRTKQTAEVISNKLKKEINFSNLFTEKKKPTEIEGLLVGDEKGDAIMKETWKNFFTPGYHYADEENFEDLKERAIKAADFLEQQKAEHIVVVTHGWFLRFFLGTLVFGRELNQRELQGICHFETWNTGISVCKFQTERESSYDTGWRIETWNDQNHLS